MPDRLAHGFDRLRDLIPEGADVMAAGDVVADDLPDDASLRDLLGGRVDGYDPSADREALPRIRPILVALAARAAGAEQVDGEAMYAAELLHLALHLHDAALGRRGGRRRWVARKVVKRGVSWLGGNHLTLRALELGREARPEVLGEVMDTLRSFADGQELLRVLAEGQTPTRDDWLEHADAHTGALFSFCCRAGAYVAGAERPVLRALGRYGRHLGRVWHIAEDLSELARESGGTHLLARAVAARPVLIVVVAAEFDPEVAELWADLVQTPDSDAADVLAARLLATPAVSRCREVMLRESWSARRALEALDESRYRKALDRFAHGLVKSGS